MKQRKNQPVIRNPDIQVGKLMDQSTELTVTLLTEPDSNLTADGEAAPVDVQLVYLSDDSKFRAADYDCVATTALPDVLGKNYIDHQDFNLLPDTVKHCRRSSWMRKPVISVSLPIFQTTVPQNGNKLSR